MRPRDLLVRMRREPFKPFRVHLNDGSTIDLTKPNMIVGVTEAVLPVVWSQNDDGYPFVKRWKTIQLEQIVQIDD